MYCIHQNGKDYRQTITCSDLSRVFCYNPIERLSDLRVYRDFIYTEKVDITDSSGQAQNPLYRDNPFYRKSDIADSENVRYNGFYLLLDICYISF